MFPGVVPGTPVNYQGRSTVSIPDAFDGSLVQTLAKLFERGGDDGAGRGTLQLPPEVTPGVGLRPSSSTSIATAPAICKWRSRCCGRPRLRAGGRRPSSKIFRVIDSSSSLGSDVAKLALIASFTSSNSRSQRY